MEKITITDLTKYYGKLCAVNHISFKLEQGRITALCGKNGSGKSTSIRCLLGILKPDGGDVLADGGPWKRELCKIGYLPEERGLFLKESVYTQLLFLAKLKGVKKAEARKAADYWLGRFGVSEYRDKTLGSLSKGNQQKIQMIAALIHSPQLLILDEPFSGLDPVNMQLFLEVLQELKKKEICILISSHQLGLVEGICEDICIIDRGAAVFSGSIFELQKRYARDYIYFTTFRETVSLQEAEKCGPYEYRICLKKKEDFRKKLDEILDREPDIEDIGRRKMSLQETFISLVGGEHERF